MIFIHAMLSCKQILLYLEHLLIFSPIFPVAKKKQTLIASDVFHELTEPVEHMGKQRLFGLLTAAWGFTKSLQDQISLLGFNWSGNLLQLHYQALLCDYSQHLRNGEGRGGWFSSTAVMRVECGWRLEKAERTILVGKDFKAMHSATLEVLCAGIHLNTDRFADNRPSEWKLMILKHCCCALWWKAMK